jgi:predicted oxidoreductase
MRLPSLEPARAERFIHAALDYGLNFFDHADIYGRGQAEERFAQAFRTTQRARDTIIVQSKCGIRPGLYDLSQEHILQAVDGSLRRLKTDYLDILLLHRPDALVEPEEVARAFDALKESGKVRYFGVSNHKPMQIELLKQSVRQPLIVNQLQLGVAHANMIAQGMNVNMLNDSAPDRDGHVLDYCRLNRITIQPWSPFQHGFFQGVFFDQPEFENA